MTTPTTAGVSETIASEFRAYIGRENYSRRELARRLGVDPMWVSRRLSGQTPFTVEDVVNICRALEIPPLPILALALT